MNDKKILNKMNKDENYRSDVLINFNYEMQLAQRICYAPENKFSPQEYKLAVVSLEQENARLKDKLIEIKKVIDGYMPNEHAMCKAFDEIEFIIKEN